MEALQNMSGLIFVSHADLAHVVAAGIHKVRNVDTVVGVPRSGMLPATMIATHLQLPLADVETAARHMYAGRSGAVGSDLGRILLVDDTANSGQSLRKALRQIRAALPGHTVTTCTVWDSHKTPGGTVDIVLGGRLQGPRAFAWNLWKHKRLDRWAFDMDGVLCTEPTSSAKVSRESFDLWARELAQPRWLPQRPIGAIITRRPEGNRPATEDWLRRHGVKYSALYMAPGDTTQDAKAYVNSLGGTPTWKTGVLALLLSIEAYVESHPRKAREIHERSGLPVWCTDNQTAYQPRDVLEEAAGC